MTNKAPYQTTFEPELTIQPIFTGGSVALDRNGNILATTLGEDALLIDLKSGTQLAKIEGDGGIISSLTLTPSASRLIVCSRSLSMRIYALRSSPDSSFSIKFELLRTLKPHTTPVGVLAVDHTSTLVATGAADGVVKVWDIAGGYVTHTFRGPNVVISALHFFESVANQEEVEIGILAHHRKRDRQKDDTEENANHGTPGYRLASGSQDGKVRIWDLFKRNCVSVLDSHVSDVRALDYSPEENSLLTASRDKTIMWWDANTWKVKKVVPVLEEVEAAGFVESGKYSFTGGINGNIRIWQSNNGREVTKPQAQKGEADAIVSAVTHPGLPYVMSIQQDHTMILHSIESLKEAGEMMQPLPQIRRISGTHDEIIDLGYVLPDRSLLALATNSEDIRIVSLSQESGTYFGADVAQLKGHEDIIICLDVDWSGHWIATGAKDNTARLWRIDPANDSFTCHTILSGHAESLGAISLAHAVPTESSSEYKSPLDHPPKFLLTGSQDLTVKRWDIQNQNAGGKAPRALYTRKAHDKDINAIAVNHSDQYFASASQDKTVKIWSAEEGEVQGVLKGHKRGVWSVKFAPKDTPTIAGESGPAAGKGLILTGSGDKTVKIWSLSDYSCVRTFEGHSHSVLKVIWLKTPNPEERGRRHVHIASAGGDGLVKVWDATNGEMEVTLDNHEDRVWALTVHPITNMIVSGSGDSTVTFWKDTTLITAAATTAAATQFVEQEQELHNYIRAGSYRSAITLALQLNHPARLLSLFSTVVTANPPEEGSLSGSKAVDEVLASLSDEQIFTLLLRLRDWNTNNRTAAVAQRILWVLVKSYSANHLSNLKVPVAKGSKTLKDVLDALKVYTDRHYKRMEELIDDSYLIEYTLGEMDGISIDSSIRA
ncbi:small nucleolar ribonucleoprotein-like protein complex subunit [Calycina marina]|uniref:Small nucleolar ribonucleoprotein-like protein complex subunit n=1 Tax=Calycina marina TaxID=1763456 RepID=A0A9P7Z1X1_9HELO|nr:small nucleolar ribonucleoprotein-like protein complex subunit [Calycina marina]